MPDQIQRARQHVQTVFQKLNASNDLLCETVLIRDGHYCGHRFSCGVLNAVWFCEENEIKFYDGQRKLIRVAAVEKDGVRRAA